MDERAKWKRLEAISQEKRKSDEESRKGKWLIRKAAGQDAEALAKMETDVQWEIRGEADKFLAKHGFTRGGKRKGARKIPGL